jgi:Flp pilus assembly protein TadD
VQTPPPIPRKAWAIAAALVFLTFLAFLPVLHCGFTDFDDPWYVTDNHHVLTGLTAANIRWAFTDRAIAYWQPLSWLSLMLDTTLFGTGPAGYHRTNLILHALSAATVFLVLFRMTGAMWRAALVAAIYAIHPLRVESVAWVAERKDVLSNLMAWLTIGGYLAYTRSPSAKRYLLVLVPFVLGLLAKPMIVTLPCLLLVLDYWPLRRERRLKQLIVEKLPLFGLALAAGISAYISQRDCGALLTWTQYPALPRLANTIISCGLYMWKTVWFASLAAFYPIPGSFPWHRIADIVTAGAMLLAFSSLAFFQRHKRPWITAGWLWFLIVIAPVSGISQAGTQLLADRFSYLAGVGLLIMLIFSVPKPATLKGCRLQIAAAAMVIAMLGIATIFRSGDWQNTGTLFTSALQVTDDNWIAHDQVGLVYYQNGKYAQAELECRRSLAINASDPIAHLNLGIALSKRGQEKQAIQNYRAALVVRPDSAEAHNMLGVSLQHLGRLTEAFDEYHRAIALNPAYPSPHSNLGGILAQVGLVDQAIAELQLALSLSPNDAQIKFKLAAAQAMKHAPAAASAAADTNAR